ncbi:MAG: glycosyltransferase family 2 protein [Candidatus Omnitrophota bacterium]
MISIIIRTKNEERWITSCLQAVFDQDEKDFEVIIVDNQSTDRTVEKARQFKVKVVNIEDYLPGKAINLGISAARGKFIVCLSGHCIPANPQWLTSLIKNFQDYPQAAGVYGRQEPMSFSSEFDKRDLLITFGLDKRVQKKDSFFHNANSAIRRDIWEKIPFDANISNIEDRVWAEEVLKEGYEIVYEPEARVYHYHGIHQDRDEDRCLKVTKILEDLSERKGMPAKDVYKIKHLNVIALIPVKGKVPRLGGKPVLEYTVQAARDSKYIKDIIVSTDDEATAKLANTLGAKTPFLREAAYSKDHVDLEKVYQYSIGQIEKQSIYPDIVVLLEMTFPFRPKNLIDELITQLVSQGLDTVFPARKEFDSCWIKKDKKITRIDEGFIPRKFKDPVYIGCKGLGCATFPLFLREGKIFGEKVGFYDIPDSRYFLEVREEHDFIVAEKFFKAYAESESATDGR